MKINWDERTLPPGARRALEVMSAFKRPMSIGELSEAVGRHENTVREHLAVLVDSGIALRSKQVANGRGRPAWIYRLTDAHQSEESYAGLASALASQIERTSADPAAEAIDAGEHWGSEVAAGDPSRHSTIRQQVVTLLDELGFDPEPRPIPGQSGILLRSCPLLNAALDHPDVVCGVHLGLVRGIVRHAGGDPDDVDLIPFSEPTACQVEVSEPSDG